MRHPARSVGRSCSGSGNSASCAVRGPIPDPRRAGRFAGAGVPLLLVLSSCLPDGDRPPPDEGLRTELGIPAGVPIRRVDLRWRDGETRILPRRTEIPPGGIVQFVTLDHRVHLVRFDDGALDPPALGFLRDSGQDSPPPLLVEGARLVLTFDGAPPGIYPFRVEGNGGRAPGEIRVQAPD